MLTSRFYNFTLAALLFYFFANQTQTGWLYVISALLGGILSISFIINRRSLADIHVARHVTLPETGTIYEGDPVSISLDFAKKSLITSAHLQVTETCPLAPPDAAERCNEMFIPSLENGAKFTYETNVYRRGLHLFSPLQLTTRVPFGFFQQTGSSEVQTPVLVYPEFRKLTHLPLLDQQPVAELLHEKTGLGIEVLGVRPYRVGDSPRHIHWRSVAKGGELISKEFAQETRPALTLVLDRYCPLVPLPQTKHTPFEMAVKVATSIADYAINQGYPIYLAVNQNEFAAPRGALVWDALLQYLARIDSIAAPSLQDVLSYQPMQQYIAVIVAWPQMDSIEKLIDLKRRGFNLLVVFCDPQTFPIDASVDSKLFLDALIYNQIDFARIKFGDDWTEVIADYV